MYTPLDYEQMNLYEGFRYPSSGEVNFSALDDYFQRSLFARLISVFVFENIPKTWNKDFFKNVLYGCGYVVVFNSPKYGVIPQLGTLNGRGLFYEPTNVIVNNPLVHFEGTIGTDCELIRLAPDYRGVWDIVRHYSKLLAQAYTSTNVSLINSRVAWVIATKNKASAEAWKCIMEKISSGDPAVYVDKNVMNEEGDKPWQEMLLNPKDSYLVNELLNNTVEILNQFDREVGIPASGSEKKERLVTMESNAMVIDSVARSDSWFETLKETVEKTNAMFGLNIVVKKNYDIPSPTLTKEGEVNGTRKTDGNGDE